MFSFLQDKYFLELSPHLPSLKDNILFGYYYLKWKTFPEIPQFFSLTQIKVRSSVNVTTNVLKFKWGEEDGVRRC